MTSHSVRDAITIACAGDVMVDREIPQSMLRHVARYFRAADIAYVNLEGPACDTGEKHPGLAGVGVHVRSSPGALDALADAEIDVVSLANNHTMDFGAAGLLQTIDGLRARGIACIGAGRDAIDAHRPAVIDAAGIRVAFLAYSSVCLEAYDATATEPGLAIVRIETEYKDNPRLFLQPGSPMLTHTRGNATDVAKLEQDIAGARADADAVIVSWHWGLSGGPFERGPLAEYQQVLGKRAIEAGASAVLGHHSHMLQGVEFHRGCPIFYGLGNFAFDAASGWFRPESAIVELDVGKGGVRAARIVPIMINARNEPVPVDTAAEGGKVAWLLEYGSESFNTRFHARGTHIDIVADP